MARKPTQPALYELIRHKPRTVIVPMPPARGATGGHVGSAGPAAAPSISASTASSTPVAGTAAAPAGPGRFVKVPVGYAYVAIGVALAGLVCVYIYGFSAGEKTANARFEERRIEELNAHGALPAVDPLNAGKTPRSLAPEGGGRASGLDQSGLERGGPSSDQSRTGESGTAATGDGDGGQDLGPPPGNDPRQPGLNYFILASHLSALEGDPMVRFCRRNGLDAHLVPDDNAKLRLLVVCPGFGAGERRSPEVTALESKIRAVGRKYKATGPGRRDFGDLYPKKHKAAS